MTKRSILLACLLLITACTPNASAPSPTPIASAATATIAPTTSSSPAAPQLLMSGAVFAMPAQPDMITFFASSGSLIAWTSGNRPSPYLDRIQRADPPNGPWRTTFSDDAHFRMQRVNDDRMAIIEYREDGEGAYNETVIVLDLITGGTTTFDRYALSKATYRGGGGAPRRPGGQIALGRDMIAWTHVSELAGGAVEGELRVAPLADPRAVTVIARSSVWIEPLAVDTRSVTYVAGGTDRDEARVHDLATGTDRRLTTFASATQMSGRSAPAQSGSWVGWLETKSVTPTTRTVQSVVTFQALNITTGEERSADAGGTTCSPLSANAQAFAWSCASVAAQLAALQAFDVARWKLVDVVRSSAARASGLQAVDGGFVWTDIDGTTRQLNLFTPAPGAFAQP